MEPELGTFNSVEEECRYWKERAKICRDDWLNVKQEYDEFVELSKQMESEMDTILKQKQNKIDELNSKVVRLADEDDAIKQKIASQNIELNNLRIQFEISQKERESLKENVRNLEQKNDDLERIRRTLNESMNDISDTLDEAYEKIAVLENELEEKAAQGEQVQRLMNEIRDLKQEFNAKLNYKSNGRNIKRKAHTPNKRKALVQNPTAETLQKSSNGNAGISDTARKNALSIITDMLVKLNTMQEEVNAYRDDSK